MKNRSLPTDGVNDANQWHLHVHVPSFTIISDLRWLVQIHSSKIFLISGRTPRQGYPGHLLGKQRKTQAGKDFMSVIQRKLKMNNEHKMDQ